MKSVLRQWCMTALAALTVAAAAPAWIGAAQPPATVRPNRVRVIVTSAKIALDNETPGVDPSKIWALPGGTVVFVVDNRDNVQHSLSIPLGEFIPSPRFPKALATPGPLVAGQNDRIVVNPAQRVTLAFRVQRLAHFGFDKRAPWNTDPTLSMTYKYTVHTLPAGGKKITLDPDLEIDQP